MELDESPHLEELTKAIDQLKSRKAAGVDGIPPEIWKHGGPALHVKLHNVLVCCWEQGKLPQDLCNVVIITLYKNKGEKSDCSNYRGITLLSIAGKVLARVLLNRLVPTITEEILCKSQCGFRAKTWDYATFIDVTKAFDMVSRTGLRLILERLRCPPKFLQMVIQLHENQCGQDRLKGDLSEPFLISSGVKQGHVLAQTLFSISFTVILKQATEDLDDDEGVYVRYCLDDSLFNL